MLKEHSIPECYNFINFPQPQQVLCHLTIFKWEKLFQTRGCDPKESHDSKTGKYLPSTLKVSSMFKSCQSDQHLLRRLVLE
jgi:hypothetical protein